VWRIDRVEFTVAVATAIAALVANLLVGVAVGVAMTFYLVLRAINHPVVIELQRPASGGELEPLRDGDSPVPGLLVLRIEGMMYTMNVHNLQTEILLRVAERDPKPQVLLIDVGGTATTSVTVMDVFAEMNGQLEAQGVTLWAAALPSRASTVLQRTPAWQYWSTSGRVHASVSAALAAYEAQREH
jgi:MFS superfamily sulfate permease-like transporter